MMKCQYSHRECTEKCKFFETCTRNPHKENTNKVHEDCILYDKEKSECKGLKSLYCRSGKCVFYKSNKEYDKDGTRKEDKE